MTQVGEYIKRLRAETLISQRELAKYLGFTNAFLGRIELGHCGLPVKYVQKIAKRFDVDKEEILKRMRKDMLERLRAKTE